jgi:spore coat protein CotH
LKRIFIVPISFGALVACLGNSAAPPTGGQGGSGGQGTVQPGGGGQVGSTSGGAPNPQGGASQPSGGASSSGTGQTSQGGQSLATGGATTNGGQGGVPGSGGVFGGQPSTGGQSLGGNASGGTSGGVSSGGGFGGSTAGTTASTGGAAGSAGTGGTVATGCPRACGPTFDQFFDNKKLATLRITTASGPPAYTPAAHCSPFNWTKSQVVYESPDGVGNVTMENVGFRWRGSRSQPTQGFKLDLQALDMPGAGGKRRFADLNRINVLSLESDDSHMMQCLTYKMMRDAGLPAPRCNHLKVYLNGKLYGVMESVEQVNKGYTRRHWGTNQGSLYGGSPSMGDCANGGFQDSQALLTYSGDTFSSYTKQYQLTHATSSEAEQNLIPMLKCGDSTATPDDNTFKTCIQDWIDVNEWLKEIAAESILPTLESLIGYYRNYYLYFKQDSASAHAGRFNIWSWDVDTSFQDQKCNTSSCDVLTSVASFYGLKPRAKLITRLTTVFRTEYCTAMNNFLTTFKTSQVDDMANVISAAMASEPNTSQAAWQSAVNAFKTHITSRTTAVQTQITNACK